MSNRRYAVIRDFKGPVDTRHTWGVPGGGSKDMPVAEVVYLEVEEPSAMLFRFTRSSDVCVDTWHESPQDAYDQATFEYGDALKAGALLK